MLEQIVAVLDGIAIVAGIVLVLSVPVWLVSGTVGAVLDAVHRRRHRAMGGGRRWRLARRGRVLIRGWLAGPRRRLPRRG
jgi:hypothetical protein